MRTRGPALMVPALAAIGIGGQAGALELGPVRMESTLGEPLRASIALALRPHEQVAAYCVRVDAGPSASGLPSSGPAWVSVRDGVIHVMGERPVADPMVGLQLTVDCPYAPHLSREYVVLVDPPRRLEAVPAAGRVAVASAGEPASAPAARTPARPAAKPAAPIAASETYRVRPGDTLSDIAARLSGRRLDIWTTADRLFAANPEAFIGGNPDRLRAGAVLRIPDEVLAAPGSAASARVPAAATTVRAPATTAPAESAAAQPAAATVYEGYGAGRSRPPAAAPAEDTLFLKPGTAPADRTAAAEPAPGAGEPLAEMTDDPGVPMPGDVLVDAEGLFVSPIDGDAAPATAMPEVSGADGLPAGSFGVGNGRSWLFGLAGSGVALILGMLLFGRRLKERFGGGRRVVFHVPGLDAEDDAPDADAELDPAELKVDFRFDEPDSEARIVRVDADLDDGTGFRETGDIDVAQDFGFADSGGMELGLDIDFSAEPVGRRAGDVIVEEEIPPGEATSNTEYDLSMIVDATQQPLGDEDDTEKDLQAIELDEAGADAEEDPFTLSHEVDYKILEQDYEDELTTTQALAKELSNAARELALDLETGGQSLHELPTVEMPRPGADETAELPRDPDGETAEMLPASALEVDAETGVSEQVAVLPDAGNDATLDIEVESATIDTKKLKVS